MKEKQRGSVLSCILGIQEEESPTGNLEKTLGVRRKTRKRMVTPKPQEEEMMFEKEGVASCVKCC